LLGDEPGGVQFFYLPPSCQNISLVAKSVVKTVIVTTDTIPTSVQSAGLGLRISARTRNALSVLNVQQNLLWMKNNMVMISNKVVTYHWSRAPGTFVNKLTGQVALVSKAIGPGPYFQGTIREWYETLLETIVDASNMLSESNEAEVTVSRDALTIVEQIVGYKPSPEGSMHFGTLNNKLKVYVGPVKINQIIVSDKDGREHAEILVQDLCVI
jgi:hypothetical protein